MKQYTETHNFNISKTQKKSLISLGSYGVNVASFIRQAIKEKIQREWPFIKAEKEKIKYPF